LNSTSHLYPYPQCQQAAASSTPSRVCLTRFLLLFILFIYFTDLIRHGKHHHHHARHDNNTPPDTHSDDSTSRGPTHQQEQSIPDHSDPTPVAAPLDNREAAEIIVNEEREAKNKMPDHKGLENFNLVEKMGELVQRCLSSYLILPIVANLVVLSQMSIKQLTSRTGKMLPVCLIHLFQLPIQSIPCSQSRSQV